MPDLMPDLMHPFPCAAPASLVLPPSAPLCCLESGRIEGAGRAALGIKNYLHTTSSATRHISCSDFDHHRLRGHRKKHPWLQRSIPHASMASMDRRAPERTGPRGKTRVVSSHTSRIDSFMVSHRRWEEKEPKRRAHAIGKRQSGRLKLSTFSTPHVHPPSSIHFISQRKQNSRNPCTTRTGQAMPVSIIDRGDIRPINSAR